MARGTRVALMRLAGCAWLVACSEGLAGPWTPELRSALMVYDYAVYSAWLAARTPVTGLVLVDRSTTGTTYLGLSLISPPPVGCVPTPPQIVPPPVIVPPPPPPPEPKPAVTCGVAVPGWTPVGFRRATRCRPIWKPRKTSVSSKR